MPKKKYPFGEKVVRNLYLTRANDEYKADLKKIDKKYNPPADEDVIDGKKELEFLQDPKYMEYITESLGVINKHKKEVVFGQLVSYLAEKGHLAEIAKGGKVKMDLEEMNEYLLSRSGVKITEKIKGYTTLTIPSDATEKEVKEYWAEHKKMQGAKITRNKQSQNEERDYEVLRLQIAGEKYKDIAYAINHDPRFANMKRIDPENVSVIIKRLKDKAKSITDKDS
jgi:hypothetical protein